VELCEVGPSDAEGVQLRLQGLPRAVKFRWWQLAPEDAARLRGAAGTNAPVAAPRPDAVTVPGWRVRTSDGRTLEGVSEAGAPAGTLWLKSALGRTVLGPGTVAEREEVQIEILQAYTPDEAVSILVGRLSPRTAEDYDRLGAEFLRARLKARAEAAFRMAGVLRSPGRVEERMASVLIRLRERLDDLSVRRTLYAAEEHALAGAYDEALEALDEAEHRPSLRADDLEELRRARAELQILRGRARDHRILDEAWRTIDALAALQATDRSVSFADARTWATERLHGEFIERLRVRFNFSPDDPSLPAIWEGRAEGPVFKHSYENATWLALSPGLRDAEAWWRQADDASRFALVKGWFIEKHLPVKRTESKSCPLCGGTGLVEVPASSGSEPGGTELCASCQGVKACRVLIYR
jgi:hypothetical protein